ncbi:unnamed protein product [Paramecium pentaurelia]|uniref:Uncharacterized protein n=1 Tax=Paramecium pentaurelia TaxID=43138 RepID=A0A8S1VA27_9CILI|nr:unnamed protein product [Paramecium pentaurelia]
MSMLKVTIKNKEVEIANEEYQYENIVQLMDKLKNAHGVVQNKIKEINTLGAEGVKKVKKNPKEEEQEENDDKGDDVNDCDQDNE